MLTAGFASPWNWIYKAETIEKDPRWYEKNVLGTGAFKFVEYVPGSHVVGRKNEDYFIKGRPYLDGFRAVFTTDRAAIVAAVRGGQVVTNFRGFTPQERDDLVRALGDKVVVQESPWVCSQMVVFNNEKPPFNDPRVRRALTLAIDRWAGPSIYPRSPLCGGWADWCGRAGPLPCPTRSWRRSPATGGI